MKKFEYKEERFTTMSSEYYVESYELIGSIFSINVIYFPSFDKPKKLFYLPRKRNTRTNKWIDLNEPCDTREEALNVIEAEKEYENVLNGKKKMKIFLDNSNKKIIFVL